MIGSTVSVSCLLVLFVIDCVFGQENTTLVPEVTPEVSRIKHLVDDLCESLEYVFFPDNSV